MTSTTSMLLSLSSSSSSSSTRSQEEPLSMSVSSASSERYTEHKTADTLPESTSARVKSSTTQNKTILPLKEALKAFYRTKDKLPPNIIDRRELPIVKVQLSLVKSRREKLKRSEMQLEEKRDTDEKKHDREREGMKEENRL